MGLYGVDAVVVVVAAAAVVVVVDSEAAPVEVVLEVGVAVVSTALGLGWLKKEVILAFCLGFLAEEAASSVALRLSAGLLIMALWGRGGVMARKDDWNDG